MVDPSVEAVRLAELLLHLMKKNNPNCKVPSTDVIKWEIEADRLLRIDGRNFDEAILLLNFSQRHEFWLCNIRSVKKFRVQFDQLSARLKRACRQDEKCSWCGRSFNLHMNKMGECHGE